MVRISAIWPIFITAPTQLAGMSTTPPSARGPRKVNVQKKKLWCTAASMKVTRNSTAMNGFFKSRIALSHASRSGPVAEVGEGDRVSDRDRRDVEDRVQEQ